MHQYVPNSHAAVARIVALGLISDGRLDASELAALRARGVFERLQISEERFFEVLQQLCRDLLAESRIDAKGDCVIKPVTMRALLADITDRRVQIRAARALLDVIRADRLLNRQEAVLFWEALDCWQLRIDQVCAGSAARNASGIDTRSPLKARSRNGSRPVDAPLENTN